MSALRTAIAFALALVLGGQAMAVKREVIQIGPQPGPQTQFACCEADIAVYGGAAGGGKSYSLLLEAVRHWKNPLFGGVIFRRTSAQVVNEGALWDESTKLYGVLGAQPRVGYLDWRFPAGGHMGFGHLQHESNVYDWQGAQIAYLGFDELTHFTEMQFWYMLSRNRSASGIKPYVRATCNPDADSWVRQLIDWWIGADGYPIKDRAGVLRWFIRVADKLVWGDSRDELIALHGPKVKPKSLTFIPSKLEDNRILLEKDANYEANLEALSLVERGRLRDGNWNIRPTAGTVFRRTWFPIVDAIPAKWNGAIRFWDRAATEVSEQNKDPDWTRGLKLLRYPDGRYLVADLVSARESAAEVERLVRTVASQDGRLVRIKSQQDPGSAGKGEAEFFKKMLAGYDVDTETMPNDKLTRAKPVSAQAEAGNILLLRAPWNEEFLTELQNFPDGAHDDIVDTLSGAFNDLAINAPDLDRLRRANGS